MAILDHRLIESALPSLVWPSLVWPIKSLDSREDAIVGTLIQSVRQLENLGARRAGLEDMLKEMKRKDDILPKLNILLQDDILPKLKASIGSYDDLFRKEIAKYDYIGKEIAENIEAQEH